MLFKNNNFTLTLKYNAGLNKEGGGRNPQNNNIQQKPSQFGVRISMIFSKCQYF